MANQELLSYLKQFLATGQGTEAAKKVLLGVGWSEADIDAGIKELGAVSSQPTAPSLQGQGNVQQSQVGGFQAQTVNFQSQGNHSKKKIIFALVAALLVLSGGGVYAYFYVLETATPDQILSEAITNVFDFKTLTSQSHFEVGYTGDLLKEQDLFKDFGGGGEGDASAVLTFDTNGVSDLNDLSSQKVAAQIDLGLKISGAPKFLIKSDLVMAENVFYLKLNNVDEWALLVSKFFDVRSLGNKWIKLDLQELAGTMISGPGSFVPLGGALDSSIEWELPTLWPKNLPDSGLGAMMGAGVPSVSPDQIQEIKNILQKNNIFKVQQEFPIEEIDEEKAYHYRLALDKEGTTEAMIDLSLFAQKMMVAQFGMEIPELTPQELEEARIEIREGMSEGFAVADKFIKEHVEILAADVWIGKSNKNIRRVNLDFKIKHADLKGEVHVILDTRYSKINEPVTIEVPKDAVSIEELMMTLGEGAISGSLAEMKDSTRFSDLSTLNSVLALYLADVAGTKICESKKTIYASAPIKPPAGWTLGKNAGLRGVDGKGWLPIKFNSIPSYDEFPPISGFPVDQISGGSPIEILPIDPTNDATKKTIYLFACDPSRNTYEFNAIIQSEKYKGSMTNDGGDDPAVYEVGTEPGLDIIPKGFWSGILAP